MGGFNLPINVLCSIISSVLQLCLHLHFVSNSDGNNKFCVWLVSESETVIPISLLQNLKLITAPNLHQILTDLEGKGQGHWAKGQSKGEGGEEGEVDGKLMAGLLDNSLERLLLHSKCQDNCIYLFIIRYLHQNWDTVWFTKRFF